MSIVIIGTIVDTWSIRGVAKMHQTLVSKPVRFFRNEEKSGRIARAWLC